MLVSGTFLTIITILKHLKLLIAVVLFPTLSFAYEANLNTLGTSQMKDLNWGSDHVQLETRTVDGHINVFARLNGTFTRKGSKLIILNRVITPESSNKIDVLVPVVDPHTAITLYCINDFGKPEQGIVQIDVSARDWDSIRAKARWSINAGLGMSSIHYTQTNVPELTQLMLTAKGSISKTISENHRWDFALSGYISVYPISDNENSGLRFYGVNARFGYLFPFVKRPWQLGVAAGYYVVSSFGSDVLGFSNVSGPQVYPTFRYYFNSGNFIATYIKYSPIISGVKALPFANRELAYGAAYGRQLSNGHALSLTIDYASLRLLLDQVEADTGSLTFGLSYSI